MRCAADNHSFVPYMHTKILRVELIDKISKFHEIASKFHNIDKNFIFF